VLLRGRHSDRIRSSPVLIRVLLSVADNNSDYLAGAGFGRSIVITQPLPGKLRTRGASVRFYASPADTEAQTQARSIAASLLEQSEQIFCIPGWEAPAFVLYLDQDASRRRKRVQRNTAVRSCELEGVL